ncbi:hypothetical protein BJ912DRAFT_963137 [Pholiota molesta]|nr:hypothetical protein BJ912DRAFT_963137 [Pholiota molesta]
MLSAGVPFVADSPPVSAYAGLYCSSVVVAPACRLGAGRWTHDLNADARNDTVPQLCGVLSSTPLSTPPRIEPLSTRASHAVCLNVVASTLRCANSVRACGSRTRSSYGRPLVVPGGADTPGSWSVGTTARRIQAARTAAAQRSEVGCVGSDVVQIACCARRPPGLVVVVMPLRRRCWNVKYDGMKCVRVAGGEFGDAHGMALRGALAFGAGGGMEGCGADGIK